MTTDRLILTIAIPALWLAACGNSSGPQQQSMEDGSNTAVATVQLSNPSSFSRIDEWVALDLDALGVGEVAEYRVTSGDDEVPSQLGDMNGDGSIDSLLFMANFSAAQERSFEIAQGESTASPMRTQAEVSIKTGGEWEGKVYQGGEFVNVVAVNPPPQYTDHSEFIRYEGPGIESDKVGYRVYLDWRNGFDIFGKTTDALVLQDVGLDGYDSYHEMSDWGADILKVGDAVGIGGYGYWDGEKIIRVSETSDRETQVIENGPLSSMLEIHYSDWNTGAVVTDLRALLSMNAGSRLVRTRLEASPDLANIAIGIVKHPDAEVIHGDVEISGHAWTYVATWGPQTVIDGNLGMVLFFRKADRSLQTEDDHNVVSVMRPGNGRLEYYFGAAWSEEPGGITSRDDFVAWLKQEAEKLTMPLRSRIRTARTDSETSGSVDATTAIEWSKRFASSEMSRIGAGLQYGGFDVDNNRTARWSYMTGFLAQAMDNLSLVTGDESFGRWGKATVDSFITAEGEILTYDASSYNIDHINSGKMVLRYLERTGDPRYRNAADALRAQLAGHPRTSEGAFWHKQIYPWQLWLDGVYMGMPFLAKYGVQLGDEQALEEAVAEALLTHRRLRDPDTGLYYHAWDEKAEQVWAEPETGLSQYFWSRGMGWYAMALVDLLDIIPEGRPDLRDPLIEIIGEFADALLSQRVDGVWYQITDRPEATGNYPESSGSSMFVYMLAKAVRNGYLDQSYSDEAIDSYAALVSEFVNVHANGAVSVKNICQVAGLGYGRDGSYRYYMSEPVVSNDPKGAAPFILAGIEIHKMLASQQ